MKQQKRQCYDYASNKYDFDAAVAGSTIYYPLALTKGEAEVSERMDLYLFTIVALCAHI